MALPPLNKFWLYRIVHIDNLAYLLEHGMYHRMHEKADPNYINIGDNILIQQRNDYNVEVNPPNGLLGEYIPFYFGPLSPMLLNIKTGHRGIVQRPQEEIIYICTSVQSILDCCEHWCFTDGHAKTAITSFYNKIDDLAKVDLALAAERYWRNDEVDFDRMRKKQAEFLVKYHVPSSCISNIAVYNDTANAKVTKLVTDLKLGIRIHTLTRFYY